MASFPKNTGQQMFMVSVTVLPQKEGTDIARVIQRLSSLLSDHSTATRVLYKFKVSGESKLLSVIQVLNIIGLERTIASLWRLGGVEVECYPVIPYEAFARSIKLAEPLITPHPGYLAKDGLYWLDFDVGYSGKSTEELVAIWRKEAEAVMNARRKEGTSIELFKFVAQRKIYAFINAADPEQVDALSFQLPLMQENGSNVKIQCRAIQFLGDYCARISSETI